ncbi:L-rhamnose operon regulatory protein RhaS [Mycobacterium basiliense]|uniref:L-rhamnose operon regulatory protein RhaS n=1 Tax=Mycobacterium basiliense TaxID=2094119 RepID=A0A3S5D047_9MYCO|nr:helix-turn-helix transcriptional regulator [Mycobacterium basiliense]VDM90981.1 L-rhamnose operon regulatory protein RhaS [Mycobacterium basiliense]
MASVTDGTRRHLNPKLPQAVRTDVDVTNCQVETRNQAVIQTAQFHTADPEAAARFFANAYLPSWRISGLSKGSTVTHRRCTTDLVTIDDVLIDGQADCEIRTGDEVVVIQPRSGALKVAGDPCAQTEAPLLTADGVPRVLQLNTARFHVVSVEAKLLHQVASNRHAALPQQIQFLDSRPNSPAAAGTWRDALTYVTTSFAAADTVQRPLVIAGATQLLAAAILDCFASTVTTGQHLLNDPAVPKTLQTAVSFIHQHAGSHITINDVAAEVHLTPRAVQYLFRQQLNTTPTEYLRRLRLHRAHQDLLAGDGSETTVTEIAQRWGFAHTGRFAVLYRQTYGESPHTTLKHDSDR